LHIVSRKDAKTQRPLSFGILAALCETMTENEIATIVVDACYHIHTRLGPGLLESVYIRILDYELTKRGLNSRREVPS
jgi:hypothetical protein